MALPSHFCLLGALKSFQVFVKKKNFANFSPEGRLAGFMVFR
jgi:hypothetical protein